MSILTKTLQYLSQNIVVNFYADSGNKCEGISDLKLHLWSYSCQRTQGEQDRQAGHQGQHLLQGLPQVRGVGEDQGGTSDEQPEKLQNVI